MPSSQVDRNLLFGILALQNNFISREDLVAAVSDWLADKSRPLDEVFRERKILPDDEFDLIAALARKQIARGGGDAETTLAMLGAVTLPLKELKQLHDADLTASLVHVSVEARTQASQSAPTLVWNSAQPGESRYRIMRTHAHGGLGQVYVARDLELNRDVALKEIKLDHANDPRSRARFVLEAEITGGLEHPGIVPVYGLGQYADGRPYYAMRFIRGESLKDAIDHFHKHRPATNDYQSVAFRNLLNRFIAVCNAIDYAHSRGVLHRDLKPANIMIGKYGEAFVVDWGLARAKGQNDTSGASGEQILHPRSASGSVNTMIGSAVGTPNYMSPEQAAGRLEDVSPLSDVYSLGATLYSILTGKSPFREKDMGKMLRRVQRGEFPRPRALRPTVPPPIEAICLKAMSVKPPDRYASPAALAADLERWLADEPVSARRESLPERAGRWARRHRGLVASIAIAILLIALSQTIATLAVNQARRKEAIAKQQTQQFYLAAQGYLDRWLPGVNEVLRYVPGGANLRQRLLAAAADDYERLASYESADPRLELERGRTMIRLGDANRELGKLPLAEAAFQSAEAHFEDLGARRPAVAAAAQVEVGRARNRRGGMLAADGNPEALKLWRSSISLLEPAKPVTEFDLDRRLVLAAAHVSIAEWLEPVRPVEAGEEIARALAALGPRFPAGAGDQSQKTDQWSRAQLAALRLKARLLSAEGKWIQARDLLLDANRTAELLLNNESSTPSQLMSAAELQIELAAILRRLGSSERELSSYAAAEAAYRRLLELAPDNPDFREALVLTLLDRAQLLVEQLQTRQAHLDLEEATRLIGQLIARFPMVSQYEQELAAALEIRGRIAHAIGDYAEGRDSLQRAVDIFDKLADQRPDAPDFRERAALARVQLARAFAALGDGKQSSAQFDTALTVLGELRMLAPDLPSFAVDLAWLHTHRGGLLWDAGERQQAAIEFQQAAKHWNEIVEKWPAPTHDRSLAELLAGCPDVQIRDLDRALVLARRAGEDAHSDPAALSILALSMLQAGKASEAVEVLDEIDSRAGSLAKHCFLRAVALQQQQDSIAAQRSFDRGMAMLDQQRGDESTRRLGREAAAALGLELPSALTHPAVISF
jgi:eukaryotic-like serine/threonine-protein kinase